MHLTVFQTVHMLMRLPSKYFKHLNVKSQLNIFSVMFLNMKTSEIIKVKPSSSRFVVLQVFLVVVPVHVHQG